MRFFNKFIALSLVAALIADPAMASGLAEGMSSNAAFRAPISRSIFDSQALTNRLTHSPIIANPKPKIETYQLERRGMLSRMVEPNPQLKPRLFPHGSIEGQVYAQSLPEPLRLRRVDKNHYRWDKPRVELPDALTFLLMLGLIVIGAAGWAAYMGYVHPSPILAGLSLFAVPERVVQLTFGAQKEGPGRLPADAPLPKLQIVARTTPALPDNSDLSRRSLLDLLRLYETNISQRSAILTILHQLIPEFAGFIRPDLPEDLLNIVLIVAGELGGRGKSLIPALVSLSEQLPDSLKPVATSAMHGIGSASENELDALIALVQHDDANIRGNAAVYLGYMTEFRDRIRPILNAVLANEKRTDVRRILIEADTRLEPPIAGFSGLSSGGKYRAAIESLKSADIEQKRLGIQALGNIGSPAHDTIPTMLQLYNEFPGLMPDIDAALDLMTPTSEELDAMLRFLEPTWMPETRLRTARSLGLMGGAAHKAIPILIKSEDFLSSEGSATIEEVLSKIKTPTLDEADALGHLILEGSLKQQIRAVEFLIKLGRANRIVIAQLIRAAAAFDPTLKKLGEEAMRLAGVPTVDELEQLKEVLLDREMREKVLAAQLLFKMGDLARSAIPELIAAEAQSSGDAQEMFRTTINRVGPPHKAEVQALLIGLDKRSTHEKNIITRVLGQGEDRAWSAIPALIRLTRNSLVAEGALQALDRIKTPRWSQLPELQNILRSGSPREKVLAIQFIGKLPFAGAFARANLEEAYQSTEPDVSQAAGKLLKALGFLPLLGLVFALVSYGLGFWGAEQTGAIVAGLVWFAVPAPLENREGEPSGSELDLKILSAA